MTDGIRSAAPTRDELGLDTGWPGRPTDEPTEADPQVLDAEEVRRQRMVAHRPGRSVQAANAILLLADSHERLRALVGGRSAAPTRDELAEAVRPWFPYRGDGLDDERVMGAADAALDLFARSAAEPRVGRAVMRGLSIYDEDTGELLAGPEIDAAERSAAEPPEDPHCTHCDATEAECAGLMQRFGHHCCHVCVTQTGPPAPVVVDEPEDVGVAAEPNKEAGDDRG